MKIRTRKVYRRKVNLFQKSALTVPPGCSATAPGPLKTSRDLFTTQVLEYSARFRRSMALRRGCGKACNFGNFEVTSSKPASSSPSTSGVISWKIETTRSR